MKARRRESGWLVVVVVIGWLIMSAGSGPSTALGQTVWSEPVIEAAPFVEGGSIIEGDEVELADEPLDLGARLDAIERRLDEADAAKKKESAKPKLPSVTVSGVFQADAVWFDQDAASLEQFGYIENGADIRRARLGARRRSPCSRGSSSSPVCASPRRRSWPGPRPRGSGSTGSSTPTPTTR